MDRSLCAPELSFRVTGTGTQERGPCKAPKSLSFVFDYRQEWECSLQLKHSQSWKNGGLNFVLIFLPFILLCEGKPSQDGDVGGIGRERLGAPGAQYSCTPDMWSANHHFVAFGVEIRVSNFQFLYL